MRTVRLFSSFVAVLLLVTAGCGSGPATPQPSGETPVSSDVSPATPTSSQGSPARHVIYLHGKIVQEEQIARPEHPRFGFYELDEILEAFRNRGFDVSGEIRPKSASVNDSADQVAIQVHRLLGSGVPPDHITVVGASMGAAIALRASTRLQEPDLRFCVLGACLSESVANLTATEGFPPSGHILSIRESSDELTDGCPAWHDDPKAAPALTGREIVLETGLHHGFLYRPLPEWVDPVVEWAEAP